MNKLAVVSTDNNHTYSFFAPIVAAFWKYVAKYECIIINVGEPDEKTKFSLNYAEQVFGAKIIQINNCTQASDVTLAQSSRLYACDLLQDTNDFLLTSDIDMLPLSYEYFNVSSTDDKFIFLYYNAYDMHKFPICYLGARINLWKKIMLSQNDISFLDDFNFNFTQFSDKNPNTLQVWNFDELLFENKFWSWVEKNAINLDDKVVKIHRNPNNDRLDRADWKNDFHAHSIYKDCHALRPAYLHDNFHKIYDLCTKYLGNETATKIMEYFNKYKYL